MATYKTGWMKKLINGVSTKIFAISHAKCTYWDYANSKTLADVVFPHGTVLTNENINNVTKPGIYYANSPNSCSGLPPEYGSGPLSVCGFILFVVNSTVQIVFPARDECRTYSRSIGGKWFIIGGFGTTDYCKDSSLNIGISNTVSGMCSLAAGTNCEANDSYSYAFGINVEALQNQMSIGHYNNTDLAIENNLSGASIGTAFVVGNGTVHSKSNAFRVTGEGVTYAKGSYNSTGADYAEFSEWSDGNPNDEDRRGYFVTFDEEKPNMIRKANAGDYILGIVSGNPCIIGNADEDWMGRYVFDEFGEIQYEEVHEEEEYIDEETGETKTRTVTITKYKENPDYDPEREYVQRGNRKEWSAIGWIGVLSVRDDNTCQPGGYCKVSDGGIATTSERGTDTYRVLKRVTDNIVKVVLK